MLVEKPAPEGALRDLVPNRPEAAPRGLHRPEAVPRGLGVDAVALIRVLPLAQPRAQAPQGRWGGRGSRGPGRATLGLLQDGGGVQDLLS